MDIAPTESDLGSNPTGSPEISLDADKLGRSLSLLTRLSIIVSDPAVREGVVAGLRTITNAGITLADIPSHWGLYIGEAASFGADALKVIGRATGLPVDITPDVSIKIALGSELAELPTAGHAFSHAVEGLLQLRADRPRMEGACRRARSIWRGELADYKGHQSEINAAIAAFED